MELLRLLPMLCLALHGSTRAVAAALKCPTGWGAASSILVDIPPERINDGYCDCPTTGADEPETEACAGYWPGVSQHQSESEIGYFRCPQQPNMPLPLSRVNDGICDCCDGADEPQAAATADSCPDVCDQLLAAERQAAAERAAQFAAGAAQRAADLQAYQQVQVQTRKDMQKAQADLFMNEQQVTRVNSLLQAGRREVLSDRLNVVLQRTLATATTLPTPAAPSADDQRGLLESLSTQELIWMIVHACQVAGELAESRNDSENNSGSSSGGRPHHGRGGGGGGGEPKTCVPLRLAALDRGQWWETGTYNFVRVPEDDEVNQNRLADLLVHNLRHKHKKWTPPPPAAATDKDGRGSKKKHHDGRRRLEEEDYHDDHLGYEDDMYYGGEEDDEDYYDHSRRKAAAEEQEEDDDVGDAGDDGPTDQDKRQELQNLVSSKPFSASRMAFLERSRKILELIEEQEKKKEEEEKDEDSTTVDRDGDRDEVTDADDDKEYNAGKYEYNGAGVDPMAFPMLKNLIERREKRIQRGFDYAVSAKVLLDAMHSAIFGNEQAFQHLLYPLVLGTFNHGNLSLFQFWQILSSIVPEFKASADASPESQTCRSALSDYCPPRSIQRYSVTVPPQGIVAALEKWCTEQMDTASGGTCVADLDPSEPVTIPPEIPDGFAGYFEEKPRTNDDFFHSIFADLGLDDDSTEALSALSELEEELSNLKKEQKDLEISIEDMKSVLGGEDGNAFGPDGELYALRDTCHSIEAGKYTYEVCIFGSAKQKEGGSSGTDLGRWAGFRVDDEASGGRRVWMWENGTKCWNGPKRSTTVYVTCGKENKVISADEPETCSYVLEMESHIACDEEYRRRHNLPAAPSS